LEQEQADAGENGSRNFNRRNLRNQQASAESASKLLYDTAAILCLLSISCAR
jgi:hypothetical protein